MTKHSCILGDENATQGMDELVQGI